MYLIYLIYLICLICLMCLIFHVYLIYLTYLTYLMYLIFHAYLMYLTYLIYEWRGKPAEKRLLRFSKLTKHSWSHKRPSQIDAKKDAELSIQSPHATSDLVGDLRVS